MDELEPKEQNLSSSPPPKKANITLQQAIDFGEYDPKYLANFAEWHNLSIHIQWQLIRKALEIRQRQLITQYAELNNALNFSKKPHIHKACRSVERQLKKLAQDNEELYVEYSNKI
ncbi:MAG TPA: hypothetical protein VMW41_04665 [Candidatus Bathyarchaeia archaeon]|nr:hypothetical protein [Candidatus Bathyarchaeia archaeon]